MSKEITVAQIADSLGHLDKIKLTPTSLSVVGTITFEEWSTHYSFFKNIERAAHWWIGDLLNYGEEHWPESFTQVIEDYAEQTRQNDKWVAKAVPPEKRRPELSFSHHAEVASLMKTSPERADAVLERAIEDNLSVKSFRAVARETRHDMQRAARSQNGTNPARYEVVVACPAWPKDFAELDRTSTAWRGVPVGVEELVDLEIEGKSFYNVAAEDSILFLFCPPDKVEDGISAMKAWGYEYRSNMVEQYSPDEVGQGYLLQGEHGMILIGKRGSLPAPERSTRPLSIISALSESGEILDRAARLGVLQERIDLMYPEYNKIELFTDARRAGWSSWGQNNALITPEYVETY